MQTVRSFIPIFGCMSIQKLFVTAMRSPSGSVETLRRMRKKKRMKKTPEIPKKTVRKEVMRTGKQLLSGSAWQIPVKKK